LGVVPQFGFAVLEALVGAGGEGAPSTSRSRSSRCRSSQAGDPER
jgi:hypothetical protein